jgi:hypothetical protein
MAFSSDVYRTQFASALKYHYPGNVMAELCFRRENILRYLNAIKQPGGGRQDMWGINTYPADDTRSQAETTALKTPTGEQFADAYVTLYNKNTRRFISSAVLDDATTSDKALIRAVNYYPDRIAKSHSFSIARNMWYTGGTYYGGLGMCSTTSDSYIIVVETNFNFNRIFRNMKIDVKDVYGDDITSGGSQVISEYSEASCTITVGTAVTTTSANVIGVEDEITGTSSTYGTVAWNSIPMLVGTGNVCNVTVSSYPEYVSKVYSSVGSLGLGDLQAAVNWVRAHSEGPITRMHASPEAIVKYCDIFLGDVRLKQEDLDYVKLGYPGQLAYRGGSMGLIPIEEDPLMPKDEIYLINWNSLQLYNSAWMKWFEQDGSYLHRNQGYMEYELLFYSRANLGITNRNGCAALTGISI